MRYYGTCRLEDDGWHLDVEPQVSIRVQRWFERAARERGGILVLSDTPENARELEVILTRYPLIVSHPDHLSAQARHFDARMDLVAAITAKDYVPRHFDLAEPPRDYQAVAADLLLASGELLCCDDVGLGKTITAITALRGAGALPALVVTKTELPKQWVDQLRRFTPNLRTHVIRTAQAYAYTQIRRGEYGHGPKDLARMMERGGDVPDVIITTYSRLSTGWAKFLEPHVRTVVYDEIQELRTGQGEKYRATEILAASTRYRLGLSATPVYNYGGEIFNVVGAISPNALGTRVEFEREWCTRRFEKVLLKDSDAFGSYLRERGLMLQRTRAEVGRELPPLSIIPHVIGANLEELKRIQSDATALARLIVERGGTRLDRMQAGGKLDYKLRMATGVAKAPFVAEFVRMIVDAGEKVVLYGWHHETYALWRELLKDLNPGFYTGQESVPQKLAAVERFKSDPTCKVLILSLRAGAGLDGLQGHVSTVVFGELDWAPGVHTQCIGRVHRDGQEQPVQAFFLHAEDGSDPVMVDALGLKTSQIDGLMRRTGAEPSKVLDVPPEMHVRRLAEHYLSRHAGGRRRQDEPADQEIA